MDGKIAVRVVVEYAAAKERSDRVATVVGFVTGAADVTRLLTQARLVGVTAGAGERDDDDGSVRVQLSMAEIAVGVKEGYLRLDADDGGSVDTLHLTDAMTRIVEGTGGKSLLVGMDELALLRVRVFADLWRRGHFVAFGSKFGVDFLLYEADPSSCHSFAMVVVKDYKASFATVDIVSHCRVAKMVKKSFLLASLQNAQIVYLSLDHAVLAAARPDRQ